MYSLIYDKPALVWNEAFLLGNGSLGAAVYGGVELEQIKLNLDTLWSGSVRKNAEPLQDNIIDTTRKLLFDGKYAQAHRYIYENMPTDDSETYLPMGNINIQFDKVQSADNYKRELNIEDATAYITSTQMHLIFKYQIKRKYWISHPDNVLVCEIETDDPSGINLTLSAESDLVHFFDNTENELVLCGQAPSKVQDLFFSAKNPSEDIYKYDGRCDTLRFCYMIRAMHNAGTAYIENNNYCIRNAKKVTFVIAAETDFVSYNKLPDKNKDLINVCKKRIAKTIDYGIENAFVRHLNDYHFLFDRVSLDLKGDDKSDITTDRRIAEFNEDNPDLQLIETLFQFGRYLMISSSRENSQPTNLQGIWNNKLAPEWRSNYTTNINTEMNYWCAENCALPECHIPLINMIKELSESGSATAKNLYGCRGFAVNHNTDLWRKTTPAIGDPSWSFWPMAGGWFCHHLWEHYKYNEDREFLVNIAFPITEKAARFFLDYMIKDKNGYYVTAPSISPENTFSTNSGNSSVCIGSTMDMSIIRDLFYNLIRMGEILNTESDVVNEVKKTLPLLRPFEISGDGRFLEWNEDFKELEPGHRHLSHLYGVFPGEFITENDGEIYEACKKSLKYRIENGSGHTGWSSAWIMNLYASFGDGEKAWKMLSNFISTSLYSSMLDKHPPFQIDGNFGVTAAIARMLVKESNGEVILLNAIPKTWNKGEVKGIRISGRRTISFKWEDGEIVEKSISNV